MTQRMDRTVAIGKGSGGSEPEASSAAGFESFFLAEHVRLYRALNKGNLVGDDAIDSKSQ